MTSAVDICNAALNTLGANTIVSLTEDSVPARLCNQRYESVRDAVFRSHPWNSLIKRQQLAKDDAGPAYLYENAFTLPGDCLRVLGISDGTAEWPAQDFDFQIEGRKIVTDEDDIYLKFVSRVTDPNEYDTLLRETLSAKIAAELAYSLTASNSVAATFIEAYNSKLAEARFVDGTEGKPAVMESDTWTTSRL
ncbi:tail tubular protein A [uncultured Mediterranean phage uvMED]|nr:tail tubular protein A [uncultured Mediterranean phage uvMED]BAR14999.1 tail tubular protein A [uncultured Mediterranean phage uvMED]